MGNKRDIGFLSGDDQGNNVHPSSSPARLFTKMCRGFRIVISFNWHRIESRKLFYNASVNFIFALTDWCAIWCLFGMGLGVRLLKFAYCIYIVVPMVREWLFSCLSGSLLWSRGVGGGAKWSWNSCFRVQFNWKFKCFLIDYFFDVADRPQKLI